MVPLGVSGDGAYAAGATCHPGWLEVVLVDFAGIPVVRRIGAGPRAPSACSHRASR